MSSASRTSSVRVKTETTNPEILSGFRLTTNPDSEDENRFCFSVRLARFLKYYALSKNSPFILPLAAGLGKST